MLSDSTGRRWAGAGWAQVFDDEGPLSTLVPMGPKTQADVGSVTKIVATTASLAHLVDQGQLDLDSPCRRYLPKTATFPVGYATVRDLLGHRAGLWEWWPLYLGATNAIQALENVARLPLRYPPNQARHYSDLGFQLLGSIIEAVVGRDLQASFRQLVADPAGMAETNFAAPGRGCEVAASSRGDRIEMEMLRSKKPYPVLGEAEDFPRWRRHVLVGEVNDGNAFHAYAGVAGHAGLFSTAYDLVTFGEFWLRCLDGGAAVGAGTCRAFGRPGLDNHQALGWRCGYSSFADCSSPLLYHPGFPGVGLAILAKHRATVVMVTNRLHVNSDPLPIEAMFLSSIQAAHEELHC